MILNPVYIIAPYHWMDGPNGGGIQDIYVPSVSVVDTGGCCVERRNTVIEERFPWRRIGRIPPFRKLVESHPPIKHKIEYFAVHTGGGHTVKYVIERLKPVS